MRQVLGAPGRDNVGAPDLLPVSVVCISTGSVDPKRNQGRALSSVEVRGRASVRLRNRRALGRGDHGVTRMPRGSTRHNGRMRSTTGYKEVAWFTTATSQLAKKPVSA